ncbi:MAG: hypothetical protein JOY70_10910, partial [Acidisphaera sp.]|nr:hypothetical protein [Acidisphaera sp.]
DQIRHVRGSINVGWWFWETDRISPEFDWMERLESLDVLFVPSQWQAGWVARLGLRTPLHVLPWPHALAARAPHPAQRSDDVIRVCRPFSRAQLVELDRVESAAHHDAVARSEMIAAQSARRRPADLPPESYLFAVQTDAPRKGLACLLSEWRAYRRAGGKIATLLIRFSGLNVAQDAGRLLRSLSQIGLAATGGDSEGLEGVQAILEPVRAKTLHDLYAGAAALVAPSFGEGFGGTLVEAVQAGTLPVGPRHTACGELLPTDYPLSYESQAFIGALKGQLPIQPANGTWHPPRPGAIAAALHRLDAMDGDDRAAVRRQLESHMRALLAPDAVAARFAAAIDGRRTRRDLAA